MESLIFDLVKAGIAVELLVPTDAPDVVDVGVRLRTFGKRLPPRRMILGSAPTFEGALEDATTKARAGRWENLDWAKRPWSRELRTDAGEDWGLTL